MFADRTQWTLTPNKLTRRLEALRREKHPIIDLTESNPTRCEFHYPEEKILAPLSDLGNLNYDPAPFGIPEAREAVGRYYRTKGISLDGPKIFLTASTSESYSVLFKLLGNPGDRILVPRPSYPLFEFLTQLHDLELVSYPLVYQDRWQIDMDAFKNLADERTRAVIIVNPNNPTGSFITKDELAQINDICCDRGMAIISDEVFCDYAFAPQKQDVASLAVNAETLTFSLGGASKTLGLPQMKVSWTVASGPSDLVDEAMSRLEIILDTFLSVNTPGQNALSQWLKVQREVTGEILTRVKQNRLFLEESLKDTKDISLLGAQGGWYAILRLPELLSGESWALEFLEREHVFIHPGYFFDFSEEPHIVLSLLLPPKTFQEGIGRIKKTVNRKTS